MYLRDKRSGDMVEVLDVSALIDPRSDNVSGRFHAGEEMQDAQSFSKFGLAFLSNEALPRCWMDADYRN